MEYPKGSRLSPTLFGIFVADWILELRVQFPTATITHSGGVRWTGGILYVDYLCVISTDARELQRMINTCQTWSEKARMQLNAKKIKVMCFHTGPQCKKTTTKSPASENVASIIPHPCFQIIPNPQRDLIHTHNYFHTSARG